MILPLTHVSTTIRQLLPRDSPIICQYAPSISRRSGSPQGREREPELTDEINLDLAFPEPTISTGSIHSGSHPLLPKDKEKEALRDGLNHRAFDVFPSMIWGSTPTPQKFTIPHAHSTHNQRFAQTSTTCVHPPNAQELHVSTVQTDDHARRQLKPEADAITRD